MSLLRESHTALPPYRLAVLPSFFRILPSFGQSFIIDFCYGGVAQLGERTVRIRKVESSILFVSTN